MNEGICQLKKMILHLPYKSVHITEGILANSLPHESLRGTSMVAIWHKTLDAIQLKGGCAPKWEAMGSQREEYWSIYIYKARQNSDNYPLKNLEYSLSPFSVLSVREAFTGTYLRQVLSTFATIVFFDLSILDAAVETGNVGKYEENTLLPADNIFLGCDGKSKISTNFAPFKNMNRNTHFNVQNGSLTFWTHFELWVKKIHGAVFIHLLVQKIPLRFCARHIDEGPPILTVASRCPIHVSEELSFSRLCFHNNPYYLISRLTLPLAHLYTFSIGDLDPSYIQSTKQSNII